MKTHNLIQGTPAWHAYRREHFNASDAPAMIGCSAYKTRDQLIHETHTGLTADVDPATQRRFDDGHRFEALARPLAEAIIGEELYPVVGSNGKFSASFDGLTMCESIAFEHKTLNAELRATFDEIDTMAPEYRETKSAGKILPLAYRVQMEQQLMVSGAERVLFMASKWDGDKLIEERHCWYESDRSMAEQIDQGWEQFEKDVAAYVQPAAAAPAPTGRAPETLPALFVTVKGEVTASNLAEFKDVALTAIRSVNRDLKSDQDFADAEKAVKWCEDIETRIAGAKENALSQTATIDALFKAFTDISAEARQVRLDLDKLIKARKLSLKTELLTEAQTALSEFLRAKNTAIGRDYMPQITADFAGAIHGKKNFDSMRAALNSALANAKIEASAKADLIMANIKVLQDLGSEHKFLFLDTKDIVLKQTDDLTALVKTRIADHRATELAKEEATRARIQAEEQAKAEAAARAKVLAEQEAERRAAEAAKPVAAPVATPVQQNAPQIIQEIMQVAPAANVVPITRPAPAVAPTTPPSLKLGQIGERLGFALTGDFLKTLGFEPAARDKSALLFHESSFPLICAALVQHIEAIQSRQAA